MVFGLGRLIPDSIKFRLRRKILYLKFRAHTQFGRSKYIINIYKMFGVNQELVVKPDTRLVIEGAARTATTYAYYAVSVSQKFSLPIAYHIHLPAQVLKAIEWGIPVLVTIRNPTDAVASAVVREPFMPTKAYLERYFYFYQTLKPYVDKFLVVDFDEIVNDFPKVIARLNSKFDLGYTIPEHLPEFTAEVEKCVTFHHKSFGGGAHQSYLPNSAKDLAKNDVDFRAYQELLSRSEELYDFYLSRSGSYSLGRQ